MNEVFYFFVSEVCFNAPDADLCRQALDTCLNNFTNTGTITGEIKEVMQRCLESLRPTP